MSHEQMAYAPANGAGHLAASPVGRRAPRLPVGVAADEVAGVGGVAAAPVNGDLGIRAERAHVVDCIARRVCGDNLLGSDVILAPLFQRC